MSTPKTLTMKLHFFLLVINKDLKEKIFCAFLFTVILFTKFLFEQKRKAQNIIRYMQSGIYKNGRTKSEFHQHMFVSAIPIQCGGLLT